jgi:RNA polymerase sigma-70 factor (ECF subfamily)
MVGMDDREIIRRAQAGDRSAFGTLFDAYYACVYHFLYERLGGAPEAEDLAQEVFLAVLGSIDEYPADGALGFDEWLLGVAQRLLTEYNRHNHAAPQVGAPYLRISAAEPWQINPAALALLSQQQQQVVTCRHHSGLTLRQTAVAMGLDPLKVKRMERSAFSTWIRHAIAAGEPPETDMGASWL